MDKDSEFINLINELTARLLRGAKESVDSTFGKDFSRQHPELVIKVLETSSNLINTMLPPESSGYYDDMDDELGDLEDYDDEDDDGEDIEGLFKN